MLPLSYGLEVIHFLEHHHHHHHHKHHQHHSRRPENRGNRLGGNPLSHGCSPMNESRPPPLELVFRGLRTACKQRTILRDVNGMVKPGELLAVMGPSGSGKTSLLNALSGRHKLESGTITLNGEVLNKSLRRKICYVLQQDIFLPNLTLRQTLKFSALLRLPASMSFQEKMNYVDHLADVLDLRHCLDTRMGDNMKRGLSGGERKRANIACELLADPTLLLLDEPTTGLDSSTALTLMQMLKQYTTEEKKTMVVTVHQPSSQIFHMFDRLLLLCNGQVAYFGSEKNVVDFFTNIGFTIAPNYNPADFIMEHLKKGSEVQEKIVLAAHELQKAADYPDQLKEAVNRDSTNPASGALQHSSTQPIECPHCKVNMWQSLHHGDNQSETVSNSEQYVWNAAQETVLNLEPPTAELRVILDESKKLPTVYSKIENREDEDSGRSSWSYADSSSSNSRSDILYGPKWPISFLTQVKVLSERNFIEGRRRMLSKLNWIQTFILAVVSGLLWFQVERKETAIYDVQGWMFFGSSYWMLFALFEALVSFPPEREVVNKERASGAYRLSAYYWAKMLGELPLIMLLPTVFHILSYPLLGCQGPFTFLALWAFLLLSTIVAQSVGLFVGASCPDIPMSVTISALISLSSMLFGGYYVRGVIPPWVKWLRFLSMIHYTYHSMQSIEFTKGMPFRCAEENSQFQSCRFGNATFIPGEEILSQNDDPLPLWANTMILFLFLLIFRVFGYVSLRFFRKPK